MSVMVEAHRLASSLPLTSQGRSPPSPHLTRHRRPSIPSPAGITSSARPLAPTPLAHSRALGSPRPRGEGGRPFPGPPAWGHPSARPPVPQLAHRPTLPPSSAALPSINLRRLALSQHRTLASPDVAEPSRAEPPSVSPRLAHSRLQLTPTCVPPLLAHPRPEGRG